MNWDDPLMVYISIMNIHTMFLEREGIACEIKISFSCFQHLVSTIVNSESWAINSRFGNWLIVISHLKHFNLEIVQKLRKHKRLFR